MDFYSNKNMHRVLEDVVVNRLRNGVWIGDCKFHYFAHSNSQIKARSFMFISSTMNRGDIIKSYGEFEQEKNILKRMARIGQNLSGTMYIVDLTDD